MRCLRNVHPRPRTAESSIQIALARMTSRVWFAVDLVVAIVALAIVTGARRCPRSAAPGDGARAAPAIEPHQEPELTECPKQAASPARKRCEAEGR